MTAINDALEAAADLQSLIDVAAEETPAESKTGVARAREIAEALTTGDLDALMTIHSTLSSLVDQIVSNVIDPEHLGHLDDDKLYDLALEHLDRKDAERLLEVRHKLVRAAIFAHITALNEAKGVHDPAHAPGEAAIPALGKSFYREGGKLKATLNKTELETKLGSDRWGQVCKAVLVPAVPEHVEYHLDEDALLAMVKTDPAVMEIIRDCVVPGGYSPQRMVLKETKK
jgi:hypothetical protein